MAKKYSDGLTSNQIAFARRVEAAGLDSYSQACRALAEGNDAKIAAWQTALYSDYSMSPEDHAMATDWYAKSLHLHEERMENWPRYPSGETFLKCKVCQRPVNSRDAAQFGWDENRMRCPNCIN